MISQNTDLNKFGGETWHIKIHSLFHIFIFDTTEKSFLVELKEWRFLNYKMRETFISTENFEKTVTNAFDKMQKYLNGTGKYYWTDSHKNSEFNLIKDFVKDVDRKRKFGEEALLKQSDTYKAKRLALEEFLKTVGTSTSSFKKDVDVEDFDLSPYEIISENYRKGIRNEFSELCEEFENSEEAHILQETEDYVKFYWEFTESNTKSTYAIMRIPNNKIKVEWTQDGNLGKLEYSWEFNIDENQQKIKTSINKDITKITKQASFDKMDNLLDRLFDDSL